jgi:UDP-N-acetylglucosamine:LPS N-acetylglucosamine transferase
MTGRPLRVMLVSSIGGHLTQLREIARHMGDVEYFYVLNVRPATDPCLESDVEFVSHSERDWRVFANLVEALCLCWKRRPDVIISTGAGHVVPISLVGRIFGVRTIFVETMSRVNSPSLTGRLMYRLADRFYYQWPSLARYYPKGTCTGPLL